MRKEGESPATLSLFGDQVVFRDAVRIAIRDFFDDESMLGKFEFQVFDHRPVRQMTARIELDQPFRVAQRFHKPTQEL
jgi:hypothetical protein